MNLPNRLTIARLIMVPLFVLLMIFDNFFAYLAANIVFLIASLTDYFDGKIARERNLITNFGKLMDPLADKVLIAAAFVMLMGVPVLNIPPWTIVAILAREFLVTGARSMAAAGDMVIAANIWGKTKAVIQMIYIGVFLFFTVLMTAIQRFSPRHIDPYAGYLNRVSLWCIVFVALFTVYSGIQFARSNWRTLDLGVQK